MTKIFKGLLVVLVLALLIPFGGSVAYAQTTNDYIKNSVMVEADGKVNVSLIMSCDVPLNLGGYTEEQIKLDIKKLKIQLISYLNDDLAEKKAKIEEIYSQFGQFNPEENVVFGSNGKAVEGENFVGYNIQYASVEAYKYYNNVQSTYKKGFFDNPFNDVYQQGMVTTTVAQKYKNFYILASDGLLFEDFVVNNYSPVYYNDYMTLNRRTKSSAGSVVQDADNYYHHIWVSDGVSLTGDDEMTLSLNIIHAGWWYLLGTVLPLVVMGVAILVVNLNKKSKKKIREIK